MKKLIVLIFLSLLCGCKNSANIKQETYNPKILEPLSVEEEKEIKFIIIEQGSNFESLPGLVIFREHITFEHAKKEIRVTGYFLRSNKAFKYLCGLKSDGHNGEYIARFYINYPTL